MKIDHQQLMAEITAPSPFTKEEFMSRCPGIIPGCEDEVEWWEEWLQRHPDVKADTEIEFYEHAKKQSAKYAVFKILLRDFLEEHSIRGIGDFYLHLKDRQVTIRPVCPVGEVKSFTFKL